MKKIVFVHDESEAPEALMKTFAELFPECEIIAVSSSDTTIFGEDADDAPLEEATHTNDVSGDGEEDNVDEAF